MTVTTSLLDCTSHELKPTAGLLKKATDRECNKGGKIQRSVPPELKKHPDFLELQAAVKALKGQRARCREALERLCAEATPLEAEDLQGLTRLPCGSDLIGRLLFRTESGEVGVYEPEAHALSGLDDAGRKPRIQIGTQVTVVHPLDLFESGQLARWQQKIVARRIVQPFKQVFRELYLLTPAERETRRFSNRFAGHALTTRILGGLLANRGWQVDSDVNITKFFPQARLKAFFQLAQVGHFLTEDETTTSDRVEFVPHPQPRHGRDEDVRVPLEQVPPKLLSEVFRDADLFVSVAQVVVGDTGYYSEEQFVRRGELLKTILANLNLANVNVDGHFAHVKGSRASYRVHLGSAAIHVEPGNHLCVVPNRAARRKDLFLPFADDEDPKLAEVIGKIVFLANDAAIKDPDILEQLE